MPYLEDEDIEQRARELRKTLDVDDQAQPDMMTLIVKMKHLGLIKNYERVPNAEMPDDEAAFDADRRILLIRESVFCAANRQISEPRARWTIAHEIGHMALGHKGTRHRNVSGRTIDKISRPIRTEEAQAHRFAAAFLAPGHLVNAPLDTPSTEIATFFNISNSAAEIRKPELERMYRRAHGIPRPLPHSIVEFLQDAQRKGYKLKRPLAETGKGTKTPRPPDTKE
jgi:Zn-dependent peptidase ImmA (M78 family)